MTTPVSTNARNTWANTPVRYETLAGLRLIFPSGVIISPETFVAVQRCVNQAATCVLAARLAPPGLGRRVAITRAIT